MVWVGLLADVRSWCCSTSPVERRSQLAQWTRQGLSFLAREFDKGLRASGVPRTGQDDNPGGSRKALGSVQAWGDKQKKTLVGKLKLR